MDEHLYSLYHREEDSWWWSVGRRSLIANLWKRYGDRDGSPAFLEIGCGTGGMLKDLSQLGTAYGLDVASEALKYCNQRGLDGLCLGDAAALPYRDARFDAVVCIDVLEHLDDDGAALAEIYRVCKPGGKILATVPAFQFLWSRRDEQLHHKRRYTLGQVKERVAAAGFQILKASYINLPVFLPLLLMVKTGQLAPSRSASIKVDFAMVPGPLNRVLAGVMALESRLVRHVNMPIGSSIACVALKPVS